MKLHIRESEQATGVLYDWEERMRIIVPDSSFLMWRRIQ